MTTEDVAQWMVDELTRNRGCLSQEEAAAGIETIFGDPFATTNDGGSLVIAPSVLAAFRRLTEDTVVWERGTLSWRLRDKQDPPGSRQAD